MARILFWSSIMICSACIVLTTFARDGRISATPTESALGEIGPWLLRKVRERIYADGPVKRRVRDRRAASSTGISKEGEVLPATEPNRVASELKPVTDPATAVASGAFTSAAASAAAAAADSASASANASAAATVTKNSEKDDKVLKMLPASEPNRVASESKSVTDPVTTATTTPAVDSDTLAAAAAADADADAITQTSVSLSRTELNDLYSSVVLDFQGCSMNPCKNAGVCKLQPFGANKVFCRCLPGFYGEFCQYDSPECQMDPCLHGGECRQSMTEPRGYECFCTNGYEGDNCETMITPYAAAVLPVGRVTDQSHLSMESASASSPPTPQPPSTTTSYFTEMPFLAMVALSVLMLALSLFATIDAERKIVIERYAVLTAHGYVMDYPKAGYLRLAMRKFFFLGCLCCSVFPCLDPYFAKQAEEQIPLSLLLKTGRNKGTAQLPQTVVDRGTSPASAAFSQTPSGTVR